VVSLNALVIDWRGQGPVHLPGGIGVARRSGDLVRVVPAHTK
jgi:tRNA(Ile)-lysidine synthase